MLFYALKRIFLYFSKFTFALFIYVWLCCVFIAAYGISLVVSSGDYSTLCCMVFLLQWPLLLRSTGSKCAVSVAVVHRLSCSVARGTFLDQGTNLCPLHWQADFSTTGPPRKSLPLLLREG